MLQRSPLYPLSTLSGAVLYGCHPELIHARRSRSTYGIKACAPYVEGAPGKVRPRPWVRHQGLRTVRRGRPRKGEALSTPSSP